MSMIEKKWPRTYRIVLALTIVLVLLFIAVYEFVLAPLYEEHDYTQSELETERGKVSSSEWDSSESGIMNANMQYSLAIGTRKQPAGEAKSARMVEEATGHLQKLIDDVKAASQNPSITEDGKKTYTDKYEETKKYLQGKKIDIVPAVYGLERSSEGNYYNMTLKLVQTREIVDLLLKHNLTVLRTAEEYMPEQESLFSDFRDKSEMQKIRASQLSVLPITAFGITPVDEPYLLEIPLRATVSGTLADVAAFAKDLSADGRKYDVTNMEIQTIKPVQSNPRRAQLIPSQEDGRRVHFENVTVTFICTGFARPEAAASPNAKGEPGKVTRPGGTVPSEAVVPKPLGV